MQRLLGNQCGNLNSHLAVGVSMAVEGAGIQNCTAHLRVEVKFLEVDGRINLSNEKNPGWLFGIGDEILLIYMGIIINHYKDPY